MSPYFGDFAEGLVVSSAPCVVLPMLFDWSPCFSIKKYAAIARHAMHITSDLAGVVCASFEWL
jgi:hypothetical protein